MTIITTNESKINQELIDSQGIKNDIGGYYKPNTDLLNAKMRPSKTLNEILAQLN